MTFLVMYCHWCQCQCHLIPMASIHYSGQDDRYEAQHDFSCHVMPLALLLASNNAISILNVTITFFRSRQSNLDVIWLFGQVTQLPLALATNDATGVGVT